MGYIGRKLRESRLLFPHSNKGLIVPIDHGLTMGPILGLQNIDAVEPWINNNYVSAILAHKGVLEKLILRGALRPSIGVILHINGMPTISASPDTKILVASIEAALQLGADAVSIQINFTGKNFEHNLSILGMVTDIAHEAGLPVLTMLYDKVIAESSEIKMERLHHLIRIVTELGSDAIKIGFPDSETSIIEIVSLHGSDIKIFFAGGEKTADNILINNTKIAISAGASGLCVGRNVFQNLNPQSLLKNLYECINAELISLA
ncbi:class I fructose-bisphosphate aldolase [Photorhabdus khanii]|uniref:Aldolase n=1 Tax=Photorhabdus khanii subsp. guanajuatensis TaxID=2100166 RepID=A0A4R4JYH8_9GAMM|nr:aldolase [Photorhabdus khanii]TDB59763.1 aldolase [Photorhabdus khanii subsp. guanajuatensis]